MVPLLTLALLADSFAPWYDGGASAWTAPHAPWVGVLLCVAVVAARLRLPPPAGPRTVDLSAAALVVVAFVVACRGWVAGGPASDPPRLAWRLQEQGAVAAHPPSPVAWGYPVGLGLIALVAVALAARAVLRRADHDR